MIEWGYRLSIDGAWNGGCNRYCARIEPCLRGPDPSAVRNVQNFAGPKGDVEILGAFGFKWSAFVAFVEEGGLLHLRFEGSVAVVDTVSAAVELCKQRCEEAVARLIEIAKVEKQP